MPELLVMRHAKSDWEAGAPDFDRPLSKRGHKNAVEMASWLSDSDREPDAILTSAANRAQTTAGYVAEHFGLDDGKVTQDDDLYLADANTWLDVLMTQTADRLLICGHNPGLDVLVDYLGEEAPALTIDGKLMTTAAIAVFTVEYWASISPTTCQLVELMRPRELPQ